MVERIIKILEAFGLRVIIRVPQEKGERIILLSHEFKITVETAE